MRSGFRYAAACAATALLALGGAACGGSDPAEDVADAPVAPAEPEDFPESKGSTLGELLEDVGKEGPILAASVSEFEPGANRYGFALYDLSKSQIAGAPVVLYYAPVGGGPARGPVPAEYVEMSVRPEFQSRTVAADTDAATSLYVADIKLPDPGRYEVLGMARLDGRLVAARPVGRPLRVQRDSDVPEVGEPAPVVSTPTEADVGGDLRQIDTRTPPSSMHDVDFGDVVGSKPAVLMFATAALCQSRVCGPVIDIAEQVKEERGSEIEFVHNEIYRENDPSKGFMPQVGAWKLPTEPWVFTVDADGNVAARIEGAFGEDELNEAIDAAVGKG